MRATQVGYATLAAGLSLGSPASPCLAATESVVHSFAGGRDGSLPLAAPTMLNGIFYGTTLGGGGNGCNKNGCGTVYSVTPSGDERVLAAFDGKTDGANVLNPVIGVGGAVYGATGAGGRLGGGVVFKVAMSGKEKILHDFPSAGSDGNYPQSALTNIGGTLYGTAAFGGGTGCGGMGCGLVYKISKSGAESVVYVFRGGQDGSYPAASLIEHHGALYGTTTTGGGGKCPGGAHPGCGTVFRLTPDGRESVIYAFKGGSDGAVPLAGLTYVDGLFYSTTGAGGSTHCEDRGCGTVFSLSPDGTREAVLHAFGTGADGVAPLGGLTSIGGTLYGTTGDGGTRGAGIVFAITANGAETVIHDFGGGTDGNGPNGGLLNVDGALYGTTLGGGVMKMGTVFKIVP